MDASPSTHAAWEYAASLSRNSAHSWWPRWAEKCRGLQPATPSGRTAAQYRNPTSSPAPAAVHLAFSLRQQPFPPLPRRHLNRINPQASLGFPCFLLQPFEYHILWRILPIPPTPAIFDERVIDVGAIQQEHISKGAPVLVLSVGLEDYIFPED